MMDRQQQKQVWQRVYPPSKPTPPVPRQGIRQCRMRLQQNLRFYEGQQQHPVYGPAFQRLAQQTREQMQMLQQISEG